MTYLLVLTVHSWLRWVVLVAAVVVLVRSITAVRTHRPWLNRDNAASLVYIAAFDTQLLLGLALYFVLSPVTAGAFDHVGAAMHDRTTRFFLTQHAAGMILAALALHVSRIRSKKGRPDARHRTVLVGTVVSLLIVLASAPWPGMPDALHPLFRTP